LFWVEATTSTVGLFSSQRARDPIKVMVFTSFGVSFSTYFMIQVLMGTSFQVLNVLEAFLEKIRKVYIGSYPHYTAEVTSAPTVYVERK
jgi:hypothetical protein